MTAVEIPCSPIRGASIWPMSVEAYHLLGEAGVIPKNTELLYGVIYKKMPKSPYHEYLLLWLVEKMYADLAEGRLIRTEGPITCADSEPEPDISVINGRKETFLNEHPKTAELVIEICITSHDYDRSKLKAYAAADVKEVWLVLGPEKQIEVLRAPKNAEFAERSTIGPVGRLTSKAVPEFSVDLQQLFVNLPPA